MKRTTWIMLAVTVFLGLFIGLYERRTLRTEEWMREANRLLPVRSEEVRALTLLRGSGERIRCEKRDGRWMLVEPLEFRADANRIDGILAKLEILEIRSRLPRSEAEGLPEYGLDRPRLVLEITDDRGRTRKVRFGADAPLGESVYAQAEDRGDILIVDRSLLEQMDHPADAFRDRRLLPFRTYDAQELEIRYADASIGLAKVDGRWILREPKDARADREAVETYLADLRSVEAVAFIDDAPEDPALYGLNEPDLEISVRCQDDETFRLLIGAAPPEHADWRYAANGSDSFVCAVAADDVERLRKTIVDLRDRQVLEFRPADVGEVRLSGRSGEIVLRKEGETWRIGEDRIAGDSRTVGRFLLDLRDLRILEFADDAPADLEAYGLVDPAAAVRLFREPEPAPPAGSAEPATEEESPAPEPREPDWPAVSFGATNDQGRVYLMRSDEPFVYAVDPGILEWIDRPEVTWRDRRIFTIPTEEITRLSVERDDLRIEVRRDESGSWRLAEGQQGVLDGARLLLFLKGLASLRADEFEAAGVENPDEFGLAHPKAVVEFDHRSPDGTVETWTLRLGEPGIDGRARIWIARTGLVFEVSPDTLRTLQIDFFRAPPSAETSSGITAGPAANGQQEP